MDQILDVREVNKTFSDKRVVDNVSFSVCPGEVMGILGPNGAGKTTVIRMIMGITAPDSGQISYRLNGQIIPYVPKQRVGYLPEERGLYKDATVLDMLAFLAGLKGIDKQTAIARANTWLAKFDLTDYATAKIEQLSKGMAQKVQFVATVLHEPDLVVLDEPFSGLDPVSQDLFKKEIRNLAENGTAVLLSSHQMNLVEETCNRIFFIHKGKQVLYGPLEDIKERHGRFRVKLRGAPQSLADSDLVEQHEYSHGVLTLLLKDDIMPAQFAAQIPEDMSITEMVINRISLHDIFVRVATGGELN